MNLPEKYNEVVIKNKFDKVIGVGFVDTYSNMLYVFSNQGTIQYNSNEVKELFWLYNLNTNQKEELR